MKVGIYNRHLSVVGGAEKHMLAMAETLSRHHTVDVLTPHVLDLEVAGAALGVDLSRVRLRPLCDRPDPELAPVTAGYDLFINASDGTFLPSHAPRSILLVYFPTPVSNTLWTRFKWHLGHRVRQALLVPRYAAGFYGPEKLGDLTVRWTKRRARLEIPAAPGINSLDVRLTLTTHRPMDPVGFFVDGQQVAACVVSGGRTTVTEVSFSVQKHGPAKLDIVIPPDDRSRDERDLGVAVVDVQVNTPRYRLYQLVFRCWFRELGQRLDSLYPVLNLSHLDTYDRICANSQYTQRWIRRYWARDSIVFYPPVDIEGVEALPKRRQILSVGRFFTTGHNKKHLAMIHAFREMVAEGLTGWELHLAGGTSLGDANAEYLARVREAARGAPIRIHTDIPLDVLRRLYSESAIYWHAAGYGEDPERHPLRYEHFGLTTVEAMGAGAVPVVIDGGGQSEIVTPGVDGFLWTSIEQLKALTGRLVANPELCRQMATAARERSRAFGRESFESRLWSVIEDLLRR